MLGLDTNILIRYLTQDDPKQSAQATLFIEEAIAKNVVLWVNTVTLCEVVRVLSSNYKESRKGIINILQILIESSQIHIESRETVKLALEDYAQSNRVGFSDCLIGRLNQASKCKTTFTFDKRAAANLTTFSSL